MLENTLFYMNSAMNIRPNTNNPVGYQEMPNIAKKCYDNNP